jgi:hypothetical protein
MNEFKGEPSPNKKNPLETMFETEVYSALEGTPDDQPLSSLEARVRLAELVDTFSLEQISSIRQLIIEKSKSCGALPTSSDPRKEIALNWQRIFFNLGLCYQRKDYNVEFTDKYQ